MIMNYENWTILIGFTIGKFPHNDYATIFSHSDSNGFSFVINNLNSNYKNPILEFRKNGSGNVKHIFVSNFVPTEGQT